MGFEKEFCDVRLHRYKEDKKIAEVVVPLKYTDEEDNTYEVPTGFFTDFASVPRFLWHIIPPIGKYTNAAILHDWLYDGNCETRKKADKLFYQAMRESLVDKFLAGIMWFFVRCYGSFSYKDPETKKSGKCDLTTLIAILVPVLILIATILCIIFI